MVLAKNRFQRTVQLSGITSMWYPGNNEGIPAAGADRHGVTVMPYLLRTTGRHPGGVAVTGIVVPLTR